MSDTVCVALDVCVPLGVCAWGCDTTGVTPSLCVCDTVGVRDIVCVSLHSTQRVTTRAMSGSRCDHVRVTPCAGSLSPGPGGDTWRGQAGGRGAEIRLALVHHWGRQVVALGDQGTGG